MKRAGCLLSRECSFQYSAVKDCFQVEDIALPKGPFPRPSKSSKHLMRRLRSPMCIEAGASAHRPPLQNGIYGSNILDC